MVDERLWTAIARESGARSNSAALVGTPDQVAQALARHVDLGVGTLLIHGFNPLDDATDDGRALKLIVPFPPGGAADAVGRLHAEKLAEVLKQPAVADNQPGAGSASVGDTAARAAPDGHTLTVLAPPAGTPQAIVTRLSAELATISRQPALRQRLADLGLDTLHSPPAQFAALIQRTGIRSG